MLLRALQDVPSTVSAIRRGDVFREPDEERAADWIRSKVAEPLDTIKLNSRGWTGLHWDGATVVCIGAGPSLKAEQCDAVAAWRERTGGKAVVVNTSFRLAPWADVVYACDARWWAKYREEVAAACSGELWTQDAVAAGDGVKLIKSDTSKGLSKRVGVIAQGNNGGYQAVGLAYAAGAARVVLLGYDMHDRGGSHWHGDHPPGLNVASNFKRWIENFGELATDLTAAGVEVVNATPGTALRCFKKLSLEDALA